jgi:ABC-type polysaccharide/polyol phosphate export permease
MSATATARDASHQEARPVGLVSSTGVITRRALTRFFRTPQEVIAGTATSAMFMLIFLYVFGGEIGIPGVSYVDFLVPGFLTAAVLFTGMGTAAAVAEDLEHGFVDRVRSLPISRLSFLAFPLSFVSSAYVRVESLPGVLRAFAEHQPLTVMIDAVRALTLGPAAEALLDHATGYYVTRSLLWVLGILVVSIPLAMVRFNRGE